MAVGKGSMARASRAAKKSDEVKSLILPNPVEETEKITGKKRGKSVKTTEEETQEAKKTEIKKTEIKKTEIKKEEKNTNKTPRQFVSLGEEMPIYYL